MTDLIFKSFPDALDDLAVRLGKRKFMPGEYYIVLTPDRYTLQVEKKLFAGGGALDCEVLTISRLCRRVLGEAKMLSREAGVMLTARAIAAVDRLEYYSGAVKYTDFAREVYETLQQMGSSGVDPSALAVPGATGEKLRDLAAIKAEYDRLKGEYSDFPDRLRDLIAAVKDSPLVRGSHIYAIGYKDITKLNKGVFDALKSSAASFFMYDADVPAPRGSLTVYSAPDAVTEYKVIAADIRNYLATESGADCDDVSIICPEPRSLIRILDEYGIPNYADNVRALFDTPPLSALYCLYRLRKGDAETLVTLAKNPFSGVAADDAERLELYFDSHGIEYGAEDAEPADPRARRALKRIKDILAVFRAEEGFADACERVMEKCGFEKIGQDIYKNETDMIGPINELLTLLRVYAPAGDHDAEANVFFSAARAVAVKSLPRMAGRVSVCEPRALRLTRCKKLYVADFNDGVLPAVTSDNGLLSDRELDAMGNVVEPSVRELNKRDRAELLAVISNAADVFCAYSTAGGARRSAFIAECVSDPSGITAYDHAHMLAELKASDNAAEIARVACTAPAAREVAARGMSKHSLSIAAAVDDVANKARPFDNTVELRRDKLAVTELTHWFCCPYKRFLSDSVGLKERRKGLAATDFGTIMHDFMREWLRTVPLDASHAAVQKIVYRILDNAGILNDDKDRLQRDRLVRDACDYAALNIEILEAGSYRPDPQMLERPFGGELTLGESGVRFTGVIDRVDVCGGSVRVIDYKTGSKSFEIEKCYDGRDMQLPLYSAVLKKHVTGMFYLPLRSMYAKCDPRLLGCVIGEPDVVVDYDKKLETGERSVMIPARLTYKQGAVTGVSGPDGNVLSAADLEGLIDACVANAELAADEINSGYIERAPADGECGRCPYYALCEGKKPRVYDEGAGNEQL